MRFVAGFIDSLPRRVNDQAMDLDELLPKAPGDPLVLLIRAKAKIQFAANHRLSAESLFKR
jgi:hypothetical protein